MKTQGVCISKHPVFSLFHDQPIYHFGKKVLFVSGELHDRVNRQKGRDVAEPALFGGILTFTLKHTAMHVF